MSKFSLRQSIKSFYISLNICPRFTNEIIRGVLLCCIKSCFTYDIRNNPAFYFEAPAEIMRILIILPCACAGTSRFLQELLHLDRQGKETKKYHISGRLLNALLDSPH